MLIRAQARRHLAAGVAVLAAVGILLAAAVPSDASAVRAASEGEAPAVTTVPASLLRHIGMNEIQTINTHNSYKRETSLLEQATYDRLRNDPAENYAVNIGYSHASLSAQLDDQNVRGLELDLYGDPEGGLYAEPLVRKELGLGALPDPAWRLPGIKTLHMPDVDYNTTCVAFADCLRQVQAWSTANPTHVPIFIMLELKQSSSYWVERGGAVAPAWDEAAVTGIDAAIRSVFDDSQMITPDDVRIAGKTLEQSVTTAGWPSLAAARGKVMFFFNNLGSTSAYSASAPNLEGRAAFVNAAPGEPNAAYRGRDEVDVLSPEIQDLVGRGYMVRTRSDISLSTVREIGTQRVQQSLDSGAQIISTDFPVVGMSARYGTDFVSRLPGKGPARCNPINAPRGCVDALLEAPVDSRH